MRAAVDAVLPVAVASQPSAQEHATEYDARSTARVHHLQSPAILWVACIGRHGGVVPRFRTRLHCPLTRLQMQAAVDAHAGIKSGTSTPLLSAYPPEDTFAVVAARKEMTVGSQS